MKVHSTREASPEEVAAIVADIQRREVAGEEVRASLSRLVSSESIAAALASLPEDSRRRFATECLDEPPVRRTFKVTHRKKS